MSWESNQLVDYVLKLHLLSECSGENPRYACGIGVRGKGMLTKRGNARA